MGFGKLARIEDRPTPPQVYNARVYILAFIATFAAVMIGYDSAFIGTSISLASFKAEFGLTDKTTKEFGVISANIVSLYQAGCFFGALFGYPIGYFAGRKWGLFIAAFVFNVGAAMQIGASYVFFHFPVSSAISYIQLFTVPKLACLSSMLAVSSSVWLLELPPTWPPSTSLRSHLLLFEGVSLACTSSAGKSVEQLVCLFSTILPIPSAYSLYRLLDQLRCQQEHSIKSQTVAYCLCCPAHRMSSFLATLLHNLNPLFQPGGMLMLGSVFLSESPRWLVSRDRNESALKSLAHIRSLPADHPYVVEEYRQIEENIQHERSLAGAGFWGPIRTVLYNRRLIMRLALGCSLFAWQNATGINAINYYSCVTFLTRTILGY